MFVHDTPAAFYGRGLKITSDILEKWYSEYNGTLQEFQNYLLEQTFDNLLFAAWSLRLEKQANVEVNSRWYELIAEFAGRGACEQEWCHTIFILDNNQFVIHRQSTALLSHGLTGLSSWPASIFLGDYLMNRIDLVKNKRVIELGAGSGLLGLALLKYSNDISSYTFTDYSPMILNLLRQNALLNYSDEQLIAKSVNIEELDWNHCLTETVNSDSFDFILAADVVYDPSIIENLVKTIRILLQNNRASCAYIANAIRNDSTYSQFQRTLIQSSIKVHPIAKDACQSIEILQLTV
ncbi:unnamed protein product [Adineta ricciae]|nr:unnamed protein product [Adineta ricciae]